MSAAAPTFASLRGALSGAREQRRWAICPTCEGHGSHSHHMGCLSGEALEELTGDDEYADRYFGGFYDKPCEHCHGTGKVRAPQLPEPQR